MSNDSRYDDILRRIQQRNLRRKPDTSLPLRQVLDNVNAFGFLEDVQARRYPQIVCFGPKAVQGATWAGVVIWYKSRGYYSYRTLTLLGIWAASASETITLQLGTKILEFTGHYYNAESYHKHLPKRFDIYYQDDGSPPSANFLYTTFYDPVQRLAIRQALQTALKQWADEQV